MDSSFYILALTAASIGFFHTLLGPDHYIPFIILAKSQKWNNFKTVLITTLCGIGHVGSSILLGMLGVAFGWSLKSISIFENTRGNIAAWLLISFGFIYMIWGLYRARKNKPHTHWHAHSDEVVHKHTHVHKGNHAHVHMNEEKKSITPWILFIIFVFGPCEPLIPLLIYPAAEKSIYGLSLVVLVFSLVTIITMNTIVLMSTYGLKMVWFGKMEKYTHAIAGAFIFLSGIGVQFFGL